MRLLAEAREAFPANPIIPQYFGDVWTQPGQSAGQSDGGREDSWGWVAAQRRAVVGMLSVTYNIAR